MFDVFRKYKIGHCIRQLFSKCCRNLFQCLAPCVELVTVEYAYLIAWSIVIRSDRIGIACCVYYVYLFRFINFIELCIFLSVEWLAVKTRLWNDFVCRVDIVKLYSLTYLVFWNIWFDCTMGTRLYVKFKERQNVLVTAVHFRWIGKQWNRQNCRHYAPSKPTIQL